MEEEEKLSAEQLREMRLAFKRMLESPAWERLVAVAEQQAALRLNQAVGAMEGLGDALKRNFTLGERAGILLFVQLPQAILEKIEEDLKEVENASAEA